MKRSKSSEDKKSKPWSDQMLLKKVMLRRVALFNELKVLVLSKSELGKHLELARFIFILSHLVSSLLRTRRCQFSWKKGLKLN